MPLFPVLERRRRPRLQRGRLATAVDGGGVATSGAIGAILEPDGPLAIHDEEVPATGATVTRTWQMARTGDGGIVVWVGRRKSAGPTPPRRRAWCFDEVVQAADSPDIDAARRISICGDDLKSVNVSASGWGDRTSRNAGIRKPRTLRIATVTPTVTTASESNARPTTATSPPSSIKGPIAFHGDVAGIEQQRDQVDSTGCRNAGR